MTFVIMYILQLQSIKQQILLLITFFSFLLLLQSVTFKTTSRNLTRAMCMKNLKLTLVIVLVALVSTDAEMMKTSSALSLASLCLI